MFKIYKLIRTYYIYEFISVVYDGPSQTSSFRFFSELKIRWFVVDCFTKGSLIGYIDSD